jgi:NhaA family Na+:H+ antiporter
MNFRHITALGLLAGIGFTMSLFISSLAFDGEPQLLIQAKIGILGGSLLAGMLGVALFLANRPST